MSWELKEIADIRICKTADAGRVLLGLISPIMILLKTPRSGLVRISVMLPSGTVEDVTIRAAGVAWIDQIEQRLRQYLGLANAPATP